MSSSGRTFDSVNETYWVVVLHQAIHRHSSASCRWPDLEGDKAPKLRRAQAAQRIHIRQVEERDPELAVIALVVHQVLLGVLAHQVLQRLFQVRVQAQVVCDHQARQRLVPRLRRTQKAFPDQCLVRLSSAFSERTSRRRYSATISAASVLLRLFQRVR